MPTSSREHRAAVAVARCQAGMITMGQARAAGLTASTVRRLVERRTWTSLSRGCYLVSDEELFGAAEAAEGAAWAVAVDADAVDVWKSRVRAALATRHDAVVCGVTAARLHRLQALPLVNVDEAVHVMTPRGSGRSGEGIVVHRSDPGRPVRVRGVRATSVERTVADLVLAWPRVDAVMLLDDALHPQRRLVLGCLQLWRVRPSNLERRGVGHPRFRAFLAGAVV